MGGKAFDCWAKASMFSAIAKGVTASTKTDSFA
jgi:hypothetical protein